MKSFLIAPFWNALLLIVCFGCASQKADPDPVQHLNSSFELSRNERVKLSREAEAGNADAAFRLHLFYELTTSDRRKAEKWLKLSAELGQTAAEYSYARRLRDSSRGEDHIKSVEFFMRAARKGDRHAEVALADLLESGRGSPMDLGSARMWYEKAARAGDYDAGEKLIEFLATGKGGPVDRSMAYAWANLLYSRLRGSVTGESVLATKQTLRSGLTAEELQRSEKELAVLEKTVLPEADG